jgi:hypothetical protein
MKEKILLLRKMLRYNLKIIFAHKFIYFLVAALAFYLLIAVISLLDASSYPSSESVYNILLFPVILLVFYPSAFGVQNDMDIRIIEIMFGIPDYRYKIWLVRLLVLWLAAYVWTLLLAQMSQVLLAPVPVLELAAQVMFPVIFLSAFMFMISTLVRSGNGSAAVIIIIGIVLWIFGAALETSRWNLFFNPFKVPSESAVLIFNENLFYNRLYLMVGAILSVLMGLLRLQKREKFV